MDCFFYHRGFVKYGERDDGGGEKKWILQDEGANRELIEIIGIIGKLSSKIFQEAPL